MDYDNVKYFVEQFAKLSPSELYNLCQYIKQGNEFLLGENAGYYFKDGCGCPAMIASGEKIPVGASRYHPSAHVIYCKFDYGFGGWLSDASQVELYTAVKIVSGETTLSEVFDCV